MTERKNRGMPPSEKRTAFGLAGVYGVRMLGLFMILPVFALYVRDLDGATVTLTGLAVGIYGLTQAIFQIPLGALSDKIGRKQVIVGGLLVFALGSVIAAMATTVTGVIIGRAVQGCGAVAAATLALAADLTRESRRALVMAVIGMSIGLAFAVSMVMGPLLQQLVGVQGLFWLTVLLAFLAIIIVLYVVPSPVGESDVESHTDSSVKHKQANSGFSGVLLNLDLQRLNFGIFTLHALLAANFVVFPLLLVDSMNVATDDHWKIYLAVMLISIVLMLPFLFFASRKQKTKQVFIVAVIMLLIAQVGLFLASNHLWVSVVVLVVFFTGFNILEASLPSLVSQTADISSRGAAMGVYSTTQFLGIFVGGMVGGLLADQFSATAPYLFGAVLTCIWLVIAFFMKVNKRTT